MGKRLKIQNKQVSLQDYVVFCHAIHYQLLAFHENILSSLHFHCLNKDNNWMGWVSMSIEKQTHC